MVVAILGILGGIAIGVTPGIINTAKGQSGAQQLASFLKRHREMAISRRRNIEISVHPSGHGHELAACRSRSGGRADAAAGGPRDDHLRRPRGVPPLPGGEPGEHAGPVPGRRRDAINLGGADPVMFTSEGSFTDVNGDPINATFFLGIPNQVNTANALTIIGTTATVRTWRNNGSQWVQ